MLGTKVRVTAARGGYEAYVLDVVGGPTGDPSYVLGITSGICRGQQQVVSEADIAEVGLATPAFAPGDAVTLDGCSGLIVGTMPGGAFDVLVTTELRLPNRHGTCDHFAWSVIERNHQVEPWRLAYMQES